MPLTPPKIVYKFPNIVPPNAQTLFESLPGYEWANRLQTYLQQALPTSASTGGGPSTPFPQANYALVTSLNASLTNARLLTAGTNITIVDGGPNGPVTINSTGGGGGGGVLHGADFSTPGSFTFNIPPNVTSLLFTIVGAGGAGGGSTTAAFASGGGGSGEIVDLQPQICVGGGTITGTIGAGGIGVTGGDGLPGGNTTCGLFTALGGLGGVSGATAGNGGQGGGPNGGAGGPRGVSGGNPGVIGLAESPSYFGGGGGGGGGSSGNVGGGFGAPAGGQSGGSPGSSTGGTQAGGGGGSSTPYGVGASGGNGGSNGANATIRGTGGGGGGGNATNSTGGNGGNGYVLIQWVS